MNIFYTSDDERDAFITLAALIEAFDENETWGYGAHKETMRDELESRGWYEGFHDSGHFLVLNLDKLPLYTKEAIAK